MGGKCCTDRKDAAAAKDPSKAPGLAGAAGTNGTTASDAKGAGAKEQRKSVYTGNAYDTKKRAISIGYQSKGDDAHRFDKAFEANDLEVFVDLLKSTQPIDKFEERMHPWAEDPRTVGALAGTQLAILASTAETEDPGMRRRIREAGAIPPLVDFLRSDQEDRVQTAVVALSFLTADCPENVAEAYSAGALELLLKHVDSPVAGMCAAAATTLRNICMESDEYRRKFVKMGGIASLVRQLSISPGPLVNAGDMQLEAVLNLQDLLEDDEGDTIEEYALEAIKAGAEAKLQDLAQVEDDEVRASAEEVLAVLAGVRR